MITNDQRSGKITNNQAKTALTQIKSIHKQMLDDVKANGNKDLTPAQETEMKFALAANEKSL